MNNKSIQPPKWANRLLEWYCKPSLLEDLQGDLYEYFERDLKDKGKRRARINYTVNVLKFFKPYTIKKLEILDQLTQFIMFKNYFKTSLRSIARNKLFSAINVFGLAVSMSVCLLMISIFTEVKSYDRFHDQPEKVYRILNTYQYLSEEPSLFASTSIQAGKRLKEEIPGIASTTLMRRNFGGDLKIEDQVFPLRGIWADEDFFNVFSFEMIYGDPESALAEPNTIILTDENAEKIFKRLNVVGETAKIGDDEYIITGVVKKPPFNSHLKFGMIGSFITMDNQQMQRNSKGWLSWSNMWMNYAYFRLEDNTNIASVNDALARISQEENEKLEHTTITAGSQNILDIMTGPNLSNSIGNSFGSTALWILAALSFIVILSAGFNYTNLSIARSLRRAKEVGVRKVVGASRKQIFSQFTVEACVISLGSLLIAYFLFYIIKPLFLNLNPEIQTIFRLENNTLNLIYFVLFAIVVGLCAGFIPSVVLSRLKAVQVLKGKSSNNRLLSNLSFRKALIVIQFTLSLAFIVSAHIAYKQFNFAVSLDKGFNAENVLNVRLEGNDPDQVKALFERIPEVSQISQSSIILSTGERWGDDLKYEDPLDSTTLYYSSIDQYYLENLSHDIIAGTNFNRDPVSDEESEIIVNEALLKRFNIGTPQESIGKQVKVGGDMLTIIGVVKDFHYATVDAPIESFGFRQRKEDIQYVNLKLNTTDIIGTMKKLEATWDDFDQVHPFNANFYDQRIEEAYSEYVIIFTIVTFLAFISISIAALGLLGMGVYTAETRLKEISIRKVLGATEGSLVKLLSKGFLWLLLIASAIALPLTYYIFDSVIFSGLTYRINIGPVELLGGVLVIFIIGALTIGSQTLKAAKANPAQTLRSE
ncbi:ABC transporter permease [Roseivirga pacifica]|uniref:ABC transporter permease n=1 Tax=Roseivirga pacifica TaxID=1267423 RepID=UPI003BAFC152